MNAFLMLLFVIVGFPFLAGLSCEYGVYRLARRDRRFHLRFISRFKSPSDAVMVGFYLICFVGAILLEMRKWDITKSRTIMSKGFASVAIWLCLIAVNALILYITMIMSNIVGFLLKRYIISKRPNINDYHYQVDKSGKYVTFRVDELTSPKKRLQNKHAHARKCMRSHGESSK